MRQRRHLTSGFDAACVPSAVVAPLLALLVAACGNGRSPEAPPPVPTTPAADAAVAVPPARDAGSSTEVGGSADGAGTPAETGDDVQPGPAPAMPDAASDPGGAPAQPIEVENLEPGETVPHDLVVIHGTAGGATAIRLELGGQSSQWPVVGGHFRALALLTPGGNEIRLTAGTTTRTLPVVYAPPTNPRFVRFIYIVSSDGDGSFQAPAGEPQDQASALARLRVAARLMQTFTAETMRRQGFGRRTFRLARDADHQPIVEIWKSKLSTAAARGMDGNALYGAFYQELAGLPERALSLDVAVMSMTRFQPATRTTAAHTALGGGRLGLFGSGTLYAHAPAVDEIPRRFADPAAVDRSLRDDSAGRGTLWANYATGIGAMAHELGHVFSLPHPASHQGLMWRGFDNFNRTFVVVEPKVGNGAGLAPVLPRDESGIDRSNAVRLRFHRWLEPTAVAYASNQAPTITSAAGNLRLSSVAGIRHVQYLVDGEGAAHDEFLAAPPPSVTVSLSALRTRLGGARSVDVSAIDGDGNITSRSQIALD